MACFRCDRRQTDPMKGKSAWARFVLKGEQVLMCPVCQGEVPSWTTMGDRCPNCSSPKLVVVLDSVVCKSCGSDFERAAFL